MSKTAVIYHSIDADGWMSAAIVKHWFIENNRKSYIINGTKVLSGGNPNNAPQITFIGYNYGQPIPDLSEYDKVIMCDISFPKEVMEKLFNVLDVNLIWIDHHISAFKDVIGEEFLKDKVDLSTKYNGLRDLRFAACELTWQFLFPDEPTPEIVRLLGLYDSFRHKGTDEEQKVLEFQYGARQCISNYEEAYEYLQRELYYNSHIPSEYDIDPIYEIHKQGKAIYQYLCTEAKQSYKNRFEIIFKSTPKDETCGAALYKFICINKERFNPINFGIDYHKDGYDGCSCFHYANGMWNFSLYNDDGLVDCSVIAKQFGGGGHFSASGFRCDSNTFLQLINR